MKDPLFFEERDLIGGAKLFHQHRDMPWTGIVLIIRAGHMHDEIGKEGIAHLLEHHLSGGSIGSMAAMAKPALTDWIQDQGFTANLGQTEPYASRYGGCALNEDAGRLCGFLSDLMFRPGFDGDFEHDRAIVRAERSDRIDNRSRHVGTVMDRVFYGTHRRATMTGLPEDDVLDAIVQEDVIRYHRRYYGTPNLRVVSIGGMAADAVAKAVNEAIPRGTHGSFEEIGSIPPLPMEPFPYEEHRFQLADETQKPSSIQLKWLWKLPIGGYGRRHVAEAVLRVVLHHHVRERCRAAYHVSVRTYFSYDHCRFEIGVKASPEMADKVREEVCAALADVGAIRARLPRVRKATDLQLRFVDLNSRDVLEQAVDSVVAHGYVKSHRACFDEVGSTPDDEVLRFIAEGLSPDRAFLAVFES